jgi:transcription factor IIIB subunit 2
VYDREAEDPKIMSESAEILQAIELETLQGEYKWTQILKRNEVQTGKNQMGGINLVVVSDIPEPKVMLPKY